MFRRTSECPDCSGTGTQGEEICRTCGGTGTEPETTPNQKPLYIS